MVVMVLRICGWQRHIAWVPLWLRYACISCFISYFIPIHKYYNGIVVVEVFFSKVRIMAKWLLLLQTNTLTHTLPCTYIPTLEMYAIFYHFFCHNKHNNCILGMSELLFSTEKWYSKTNHNNKTCPPGIHWET